MAKGPSGRLVVDIEPSLKREFHTALAAEGLTFKEWVIVRIEQYLEERQQPGLPGMGYGQSADGSLPIAAEDPAPFHASSRRKSNS
jgi:hypothetical protein